MRRNPANCSNTTAAFRLRMSWAIYAARLQ
jgi:hypothetical protein